MGGGGRRRRRRSAAQWPIKFISLLLPLHLRPRPPRWTGAVCCARRRVVLCASRFRGGENERDGVISIGESLWTVCVMAMVPPAPLSLSLCRTLIGLRHLGGDGEIVRARIGGDCSGKAINTHRRGASKSAPVHDRERVPVALRAHVRLIELEPRLNGSARSFIILCGRTGDSAWHEAADGERGGERERERESEMHILRHSRRRI